MFCNFIPKAKQAKYKVGVNETSQRAELKRIIKNNFMDQQCLE